MMRSKNHRESILLQRTGGIMMRIDIRVVSIALRKSRRLMMMMMIKTIGSVEYSLPRMRMKVGRLKNI